MRHSFLPDFAHTRGAPCHSLSWGVGGLGCWRPGVLAAVLLLIPLPAPAQYVQYGQYVETPFFAEQIAAGTLPPIAQRLPQEPLVVDLPAKGRAFGTPGGVLRTMITRSKDVRQMVVYGYARLVGYDANYQLAPDLLREVSITEGRRFVLHLRKGHRWSDGAPFTSEDFRYWWEDVVNHPELTPSGVPNFLRVNDQLPRVTFPDAQTVVYEWAHPNPDFLQALAQARPSFIYMPAHYLKQFHATYTDPASLQALMDKEHARSWAALHNKYDNLYKFDNPDLPTLQPWVNAGDKGKSRFRFNRNPYYHRVDSKGAQLPYIDAVEMTVVGSGLVAAKANAGEVDLQARGLDFSNAAILKKGEVEGNSYRTHMWQNGTASQIAIFPNQNFRDPAWREILRDARFRRALSLGIDRRILNRVLYFGMAQESALTVLPESPFFKASNRAAWADFDPETANRLLDEMGLHQRNSNGIRLLPDGRPAWVVVETAGERQEVESALQIIADTWREIGIKLVMRPLERDILRNRIYAGLTMAGVWYGWDNGLPQAHTRPDYIAPQRQDFFAWPMWGQHYQTHGEVGEKPDTPAALRLMALADLWARSTDEAVRQACWQEMVDIHADQIFGIGLLNRTPQPVVVSNRLRNVPEAAIWAWEPGAHFGVHRPDEFFFAPENS
ncbi:MAG: ABC transporter substrate-binding protein [Rhodobacteraceae bacterium]|nr:ABC transporter substrate-binding protein [Paracoccaceae bacterium]